jgi:hypothetical protein
MELRTAILKEHSKAQCERIVRYVGNDKTKFAGLMELFLRGEYRVTQRAGWPLSYCVKKHPELMQPYFTVIVDYLDKPGTHEAVTRNIVRLLQYVDIPKRLHGRVMNTCFELVSGNETPVAIKAFSLSILEKLAGSYPEIKHELKLIIEERWPHETAAFHSRARKILKKFKVAE